jgi:hypothetical protein
MQRIAAMIPSTARIAAARQAALRTENGTRDSALIVYKAHHDIR